MPISYTGARATGLRKTTTVARILILYSTVDGHTLEICERIRQVAVRDGHAVMLAKLTADFAIDPGAFDRIVIGASVRYGRHRPAVAHFIEENVRTLESKPSAFFSVNAVARKPEKRDAETNPYVKKFLAGISWKPRVIAIFGGKIDYPRYGFFDRTMIRFIMWMTNGPTDAGGSFDFTDWNEVDAFAHSVGNLQQ